MSFKREEQRGSQRLSALSASQSSTDTGLMSQELCLRKKDEAKSKTCAAALEPLERTNSFRKEEKISLKVSLKSLKLMLSDLSGSDASAPPSRDWAMRCAWRRMRPSSSQLGDARWRLCVSALWKPLKKTSTELVKANLSAEVFSPQPQKHPCQRVSFSFISFKVF